MSKFNIGDKVILLPPVPGYGGEHEFGTTEEMESWYENKSVLYIATIDTTASDKGLCYGVAAMDPTTQADCLILVAEHEIRPALPEEVAKGIAAQLAKVPKDGWALVRIDGEYKVIAGGYSESGVRRGFSSSGVMLAHYEADIDDVLQIINVK